MVEKEAWFREALSNDREISRLLREFERGYVEKDEFVSKLKRLITPQPEVDPNSILQDGGTNVLGDRWEGLHLAPAFYEWARADFQSYTTKIQELDEMHQARRRPDEAGAVSEQYGVRSPITFDRFVGRQLPSGWAAHRWIWLSSYLLTSFAQRDIDWPAGTEGFPIESTEQFVSEFGAAMGDFYRVAREYKEYLQEWDKEYAETKQRVLQRALDMGQQE